MIFPNVVLNYLLILQMKWYKKCVYKPNYYRIEYFLFIWSNLLNYLQMSVSKKLSLVPNVANRPGGPIKIYFR